MRTDRTDPRAQLAEWLAQPAAGHTPWRLQAMQSLAERAQDHDGAARAQLEQTLATRVAAYAQALTIPVPAAPATPPGTRPGQAALHALRGALRAQTADAPGADRLSAAPSSTPTAFPAMPAVAEFQALWTAVRTRSQVRQSLAQGPGDGGPLNSAVLIHRAMTRMGELAPGYLRHFMAYVDALAWMEHLQQGGLLGGKEGPRPSPGKPRRPRARKPG
ncbi:DUF2894 domain-containing protein [Stenotrophomonas sp. NPDC077421]|uniref:DUF2894 domain-containing protein n=1 Tax=Stenotrophomonas sp. NPDC077421 TaxID=3414699 RepID=UPI003C2F7E6C